MYSISQTLTKMIEENVINYIKGKIDSICPIIDSSKKVFNYFNLVFNIDEEINNLGKQILIDHFKAIDSNFKNRTGRTKHYHIKSTSKRSILTIFGEITYTKTNYISLLNGTSFCPLDRILELERYNYYDPYIRALVLEFVADNSYEKTATLINKLIGNRLKMDNYDKYKMTRQTVYNIVKNSNLEKQNTHEQDLKEIDTLYVMADEHWIASQNEEKDFMVKQAVIFEDIETISKSIIKNAENNQLKKDMIENIEDNQLENKINDNNKVIKKNRKLPRRKLVNKQVITTLDTSINESVLNYIFNTYNIDKINKIIVMGDGASWIQTLKNELKFDKNVKVTFGLDKYHFKQALHRIFLDNKLEEKAEEYIISNKKKEFIELANKTLEENYHREKNIIKNRDYIINNIKSIIYLYDKKLSCPMEAQISHNLAARFTARPCGFSKEIINKLLVIRTMKVNKENIVLKYLNSLNPPKYCNNNDYDNNNYNNYSRNELKSKHKKELNEVGSIYGI